MFAFLLIENTLVTNAPSPFIAIKVEKENDIEKIISQSDSKSETSAFGFEMEMCKIRCGFGGECRGFSLYLQNSE